MKLLWQFCINKLQSKHKCWPFGALGKWAAGELVNSLAGELGNPDAGLTISGRRPASGVVSQGVTFYLPVCIGSTRCQMELGNRGKARASQGNFIESFKFLVNNTKATQRRQQIGSKCGPMRSIRMINGTRNGFALSGRRVQLLRNFVPVYYNFQLNRFPLIPSGCGVG